MIVVGRTVRCMNEKAKHSSASTQTSASVLSSHEFVEVGRIFAKPVLRAWHSCDGL
jgi:hypothetical protein